MGKNGKIIGVEKDEEEETKMNLFYVNTMLYAYPNVEAVMEQIDELVERKALLSMNDFSPALEQYEKIVALTEQKQTLIELKLYIKKVASKLSEYEKDCLEYKYFKRKPKEYFIGFDSTSRKYFRRQVNLIKKVEKILDRLGVTDEWFSNNCLKSDFFKELLKRVIVHENNSHKNGKKVEKKREKSQEKLKMIA